MTAETLVNLIEKAGSSQRELAEALGVSIQLVNFYTTGRRPITASFARRAMAALRSLAMRRIETSVEAVETLDALLVA